MHDKELIRKNPEAFKAALARRGLVVDVAQLQALDGQDRGGKTKMQALQARANDIAKSIPAAKKEGRDIAPLLAEGKALKEQIAAMEAGEGGALDEALAKLPNILADDVPDGADESANKELRVVGNQPHFNFANQPLDHVALGEALGLMDFEAAAKLSGARFVVLRGSLAKLERALAAFMLDIHTQEFGYTEHQVPYLVKDAALFGTGQLPKFAEDLFKTTGDHWLIPTSEVSLTNLIAGDILDETTLPRRMTAWTPCFRSEAGSAGRDTRGMIRQHQFSKVELVSITRPEDSAAEHERMLNCAEEVLKRLGLHYRVMALCAGDTGFSARKTYDIEVWLPGQNAFREISSCSNCGDFQARRMKARFRRRPSDSGATSQAHAGGIEFVHTLNGSGLAVGRTLVAVLENYQQADGSITIPEALRPYMGGLKVISRQLTANS
ncbi:MAG: serine--tRNA ligase [Rickettsiales bacterium]